MAIINSNQSKNDRATQLVRCLSFFLSHLNVIVFAVHLPAKDNIAADALSRDNLPLFCRQVTKADEDPTPLPQDLILTVVTHQLDWTSTSWRTWFNSILTRV